MDVGLSSPSCVLYYFRPFNVSAFSRDWTISVFVGLNCPTQPYPFSLHYGDNLHFANGGPDVNFTSFEISRPLGEQEQLDVSRFGPNGGEA